MILNQMALKRQVTVLALLVIIVVAGLYSYATLPRESFPDITIPYVFVTTTYEGVAPADMEELITIPIERKLKGIDDVEEIRSTSAEGISTVAIKFLPKVDLDDALQKVRDKVDQAEGDLPDELQDDPVIKEVNFSDMPVIRVVLSGPFSLRRLQNLAEDIQDRLESIPGVLEARLTGGLEREIHVEFDLDRVRAYNVPFSSIIRSVTNSNVNMPGGSMDIGEGKYMVRVPEDFRHPSEIFSIVAFVRDGKPVYLRDLATIKDAFKDPLTRSRINRKKSVTIGVLKRSGENIVRVTDEVKRVVNDMRPELPQTLQIDLTADQSNDVRLMVSDLENNIISGLEYGGAVFFNSGAGHAGGQRHCHRRKYLPPHAAGQIPPGGGRRGNRPGRLAGDHLNPDHPGGLFAHAFLAGYYGRVHGVFAPDADYGIECFAVCGPGDQSGTIGALSEGQDQ
jgi:multidrug efflux pump subunit AcrB